jgi:hypothetical protein
LVFEVEALGNYSHWAEYNQNYKKLSKKIESILEGE